MTRLRHTRRNTATNPHMGHEKIRSMMALLLATTAILLGSIGCSTSDDDTWSRHKEAETEAPSAEKLIRQRIKAFVTAFNDGDLTAAIACFDSEVRQELETDVSLDESFTNDFFIKLKGIDVREMDNRSAVVTATLEIAESRAGSETESETLTIYFDMTHENGGWYIHDTYSEP